MQNVFNVGSFDEFSIYMSINQIPQYETIDNYVIR